jgi:hypothetical protein
MKDMPAFPKTPFIEVGTPQNGMTLRDYFAAKAMASFIHTFGYRKDDDNIIIPNNICGHAYTIADQMMKAREV